MSIPVRLLPLVATTLTAFILHAGDSGYLSVVGPGPIRFRPPADPWTSRTPLPPLDTGSGSTNAAASNGSLSASAQPGALPTLATPEIDTVQPPLAAPDTDAAPNLNSGLPGFLSPGPQPSPTLTPQVLIQFFRQNGSLTNSPPPAAPLSPVTFQPPSGIPSSTAVYNKQ